MNNKECDFNPCREKADIQLEWYYEVEDVVYNLVYCTIHGRSFARGIISSSNETMLTHRPL